MDYAAYPTSVVVLYKLAALVYLQVPQLTNPPILLSQQTHVYTP